MSTWRDRVRTWNGDVGISDLPLIQAPMAGGPSRPALATAVAHAGGIGFLAAGYLTPDALARQIDEVAAAAVPVAVNIFLPDTDPPQAADEVARYAVELKPEADRVGATLDPAVGYTDDAYREKIELLVDRRIALASFTFGCPQEWMVEALHAAGTAVIATVTSVAEADAAAAVGVDAVCAQGTEAGGHRATFDQATSAPDTATIDLVDALRRRDLPVIAAGGVADSRDVAALLAAGAVAVQVGTALLRADESGTSPTHRAGLAAFASRPTVLTRAYSGRQARGIRNRFIEEFDALAPAAYPRVNSLTRAIRSAGSDDPEVINLWAGTGFGAARGGPVAELLRALTP